MQPTAVLYEQVYEQNLDAIYDLCKIAFLYKCNIRRFGKTWKHISEDVRNKILKEISKRKSNTNSRKNLL